MGLLSYSSKKIYLTISIPVILKMLEQQMNIWWGVNNLFSLLKYCCMICVSVLLFVYTRNNHQRIGFIRSLFLIWIFYIIVTSLPSLSDSYFNYIKFKQFFSINLFLFLIPLYMIIKIDLEVIQKLFRLSYKFVLIYLFVSIPIFSCSPEFFKSESLIFLLGGSLMLIMTFPYHNIKKSRLVLLAVLIGIVIMMLLGRRNVVLYLGGGLVFASLLNVFGNSTLTRGKRYRYVFIITALACLMGFVLFSSSFSYFFERVGTGMNSREGIIELFISDFNHTPNDWIFGRGMYGEFEGGFLATNEDTGLRDGIENGYLQLILKGGCIWLVLLILISLKAVYLGLFKSKNCLCKGFACLILLYYIDMIGFGIPSISLKYILIFVGISVCNSRCFRNCSDDILAENIGLK